MFGLACRTAYGRVNSDPLTLSNALKRHNLYHQQRQQQKQQIDSDEITEEESYALRKARLCNMRKRSVEIPLENLLSGMIFLSGGRDVRDGPVLSIVQSEDVDMDLLMELSENDVIDMLSYFTFVPNEEIRNRNFSVVIAAEQMYDFFLRKIIISLNKFQKQNNLFHCVYLLNPTKDIENDIVKWIYDTSEDCGVDTSKAPDNSREFSLPYRLVKSTEDLFQFVHLNQLTVEFGGTLKYSHHEWVRFRMQVEPFICDVVGVSKRLAEAIAPFTKEELPETVQEVEESLKEHLMQRRKTFENLHVEDLASEGEKIRERMNSPSKELLQQNPDFTATLDTIEVLMSRVENVRTRLDNLWHMRNEKLEAKLKQTKFEQEANQILDWFEQYAGEFFETHNEIGESLEVAQALVTELLEFEESTKQILYQTNILLRNAAELKKLKHIIGCDISEIASKVKHQIMEFTKNMDERKKRLNDAVQLHNIMEKSINWCIEGVDFLSTYDILGLDPSDIDPHNIKAQLNQFQTVCPAPTKEEIKLLSDAVSSMDSHWGKESFEFALNRIVELNDRFTLYHKLLDDMINPEASTKEVSNETENDETVEVDGVNSTPKYRRFSTTHLDESGKEIQVTVLDVDKRAQQALNLLDHKAKKFDLVDGSEEQANNSSDSDCVSLLEFLTDLDGTEPPPNSNHLDVTPIARDRCQSAPDDMVDGEQRGLKRSLSLNRKSRATVNVRPRAISPSPPKREISKPTNPQFEENNETSVSLDDTTVEENFEDLISSGSVEINQENLAAQTAHAKHRRKLMEELLTTEEAYIEDLEYIIANYIPHFEDDTKLPQSLVGKKDILFCMLPFFLEFSKTIVLPRIRKCVRAPIKMGLVFLDHEEEFLKYALYFKNKPQQDELMTTEDLFFRKIQEEVKDPLTINAYLIKPVQRMTKYRQFLEQMIKFSTKGKELQEVQKGAKKEYFGKLKEALKMVDFVLRHGNDLLALECMKGYNDDIEKLGRILRVGDLVLIDGFSKHRRKVFLFEKCLLFCKTKKTTRAGPSGLEVYDYKQKYRTTELTLREQIPGHETRFALETRSKKDTVFLQAETVEEKQEWIQEIWDLFFSHMLSLRDDNLESYGTTPLTNVMISGSATLTKGRPLSHSMRKRVHTIAANRKSMEMPHSLSRESLSSVGSATSLKELAEYIRNKRDSRNFPSPYSPAMPISPRSSLAVSFSDRAKRESMASSTFSNWSNDSTPRNSLINSPSSNTFSSNGDPLDSISTYSNEDIPSETNEDPTSTLTNETRRKGPVPQLSREETIYMFTPL